MSTVFHHAEVGGRIVDVRVSGALIGEVRAGLRPRPADTVVDARGGALLPGLHDHHIHLLALAAARASAPLGPPTVTSPAGFDAALRAADAAAPAGEWLRGVGYEEGVAGPLDAGRLDMLVPRRAVRVQHTSGAMWVVNSAGLRALGMLTRDPPDAGLPGIERDETGQPTGRLFRLDALIRDRVPAVPPDLRTVGAQLLRYGLTGLTDATPTERADYLAILSSAVARGDLPQQVVVTGGPGLVPGVPPGLVVGPVKLVLDDHALPALDDVVMWMRAARSQDRTVAVHCVTRAALVLALAGWEVVGARPGDRIEHASVVTAGLAARMAALGLTVVTQPAFIACRGDRYLAEVDRDDVPHLYPCQTLISAGVPVAGSSDAPFGAADPWRAMAAAMTRRTASGRVLGPGERLAAPAALALYLGSWSSPGGPARRVTPGAAADLCLLAEPLASVLAAPSADLVIATMCGGRLQTFGR